MDSDEEVICGLISGEAEDDRERAGERRKFPIGLGAMWQESPYRPLEMS